MLLILESKEKRGLIKSANSCPKGGFTLKLRINVIIGTTGKLPVKRLGVDVAHLSDINSRPTQRTGEL